MVALTFFEKFAIEKLLCCHCCCFPGVMAAPGEPISDIDVLVNSVTNAGENWELDSHS